MEINKVIWSEETGFWNKEIDSTDFKKQKFSPNVHGLGLYLFKATVDLESGQIFQLIKNSTKVIAESYDGTIDEMVYIDDPTDYYQYKKVYTSQIVLNNIKTKEQFIKYWLPRLLNLYIENPTEVSNKFSTDIDKLLDTQKETDSNIALALDSNRGNEKEIAKAIRED